MPRLRDADPAGLPLLIRRAEALAAGMTSGQIEHRLRCGAWRRIDHGTYLRDGGTSQAAVASADVHEQSRQDHLRRAIGICQRRPGVALAGRSAALAHDLPLVRPFGSADPVEVIAVGGHRPHDGVRGGQRVLAGSVSSDELAEHAGVPVTSIPRTILEIAKRHRADGLAVADRALSDQSVASAAVEELARLVPSGASGAARVRWVAREADARRESALESWSWERFDAWGLPRPRLQAEIRDGARHVIARVDVLWDEARLVGEADGRLKYAGADDVYREKRREDRIRALGFQVIRWSWSDLAQGARLRAALLRHLGSA